MSNIDLVIYPEKGTHVLGSRFGKLETVYRAYHGDHFVHKSQAVLNYEDGWLFADTDPEISKYYSAIVAKRFGIRVLPTKRQSHISLVRGEELNGNNEKWGHFQGKVIDFFYGSEIYTNGLHWWLNTFSEEFIKVREFYNLPTEIKDYNLFHLTIGKSMNPQIKE